MAFMPPIFWRRLLNSRPRRRKKPMGSSQDSRKDIRGEAGSTMGE